MAAAEREAGTTEWEEMRAVFEHAEHAIAVYRFADGRVKTVCISDGLYAMMHTAEERDKEALIRRYDTDMYRNVVPEDAARIAAEAKRFATEGGRYDVVYREKVYQRNYYTLTHAVGYHHYLSDGSRIAVIVYTDIEDVEKANEYARMYEGNTLRNFLDRGELLYCNAPMRRLLRPVRNFDTGITLSEWLLGREDPALLAMVASMDGQGNQPASFRGDGEDVIMFPSVRSLERAVPRRPDGASQSLHLPQTGEGENSENPGRREDPCPSVLQLLWNEGLQCSVSLTPRQAMGVVATQPHRRNVRTAALSQS